MSASASKLSALVATILLTWTLMKWSGAPTVEYRMRKTRPFTFANMKTGQGVDEVIAFIRAKGGLRR